MNEKMEVTRIRTLYSLEQELFEFALQLAVGSGNRAFASMARSALAQQMQKRLMFAE